MTPTARDWREAPPATEAADIAYAVEMLSHIQRRAAAGGRPKRAVHAKALAGALGRLEIAGDIATELRHGIFAEEKSLPALVRFSSASSRVQADSATDVRGIAVQLEGVRGPRALGDTGSTQDLLAIDRERTPFRNAREFAVVQRIALSPLSGLWVAWRQLGLGRVVELVRELTQPAPLPSSLATHTYHSCAPIRVGPYAAHYTFEPEARDVAPRGRGKEALVQEMRERLARTEVRFALMLRLFESEARTPIEDATVAWSVPAIRVGTLVLPPQDVHACRERVEAASFDPWHALEDHRPLGSLMRARKATYLASVEARRPRALPAS